MYGILRGTLHESLLSMSHPISVPKLPLVLLLAVLLTVVLPVRPAWAQVPTPSDDDVNRIASQLYCPICDNLSLDVCPLEACQQWRDLIREQLAQGWSEREIKDYFIAQYGDQVSGEPPRRGLNWVLYLAPPIIVLGAFALLVVNLKRPARQTPAEGSAPNDPETEPGDQAHRKVN